MKIKLNFGDRINLLGLLPQEGSRDKLTIIRDIINKIEITQREISFHELNTTERDGKLSSTFKNKNKVYDCDFSPSEIVFVDLLFDGLDKSEKLPLGCLDLSEQFRKASKK